MRTSDLSTDTKNVEIDMPEVNIPAILLVGGKGTRLQAVLSSKPKPLALVGNIPFLELLVMQLRSQGVCRMIMSTGHLADQIEETFGDGRRWNADIRYSKELQPLGTAGAVKFAERHLEQSSDFLVVNGDSFTEIDIPEFVRFHRQHRGLVSMAVRRVPDAARYGTVHVDGFNRISGFSEKTKSTLPGIINAGMYLFKRAVLEHIPQGPSSLEKDLFPKLLTGGMYALEQDGMFIDIGTPEDYARAQELCQKLYQAAIAAPQLESSKRSPSSRTTHD
jgi:D-glycero-alpha-D-manno-heptose 1-phosphate guanylyltransferase